MKADKRLCLNVIATYGRSLLSLVCGIFSGRWLLMSLGHVDYGLLGVIGGIAVFITFINGLMSSAVGRFYAVSIGEAKKNNNERQGVEDCQKWFTTAVLIHTVIPTVMVLVGYCIGDWMVRNYLSIPIERKESCLWVWRFTCFLCYGNMVSTPFHAMYTAKQEIAELTIYEVCQSLMSFCLVAFMVTHPGDWLSRYCFFNMLIVITPRILICIRAKKVYRECVFRFEYLWNWPQIKKILYFAGCKLWGDVSGVFSNQLLSILVNKMLGPVRNAAIGIGSTVQSHSTTLAGSLCGAFWPVVANAHGEGDQEKMRRMAMRACRFGTLLCLLFVIPLVLEIKTVLNIWLDVPPEQADVICICALIVAVLGKLTDGHWMVIFAVGRIGLYEFVVGLGGFIVFGFAWLLVSAGAGLLGIGLALILGQLYTNLVRAYFAQRVGGFSAYHWLRECVIPMTMLALVTGAGGEVIVMFFSPSFVRILCTTALCITIFSVLSWFLVLTKDERSYFSQKFYTFVRKLEFIKGSKGKLK